MQPQVQVYHNIHLPKYVLTGLSMLTNIFNTSHISQRSAKPIADIARPVEIRLVFEDDLVEILLQQLIGEVDEQLPKTSQRTAEQR